MDVITLSRGPASIWISFPYTLAIARILDYSGPHAGSSGLGQKVNLSGVRDEITCLGHVPCENMESSTPM